MGLRGGDPGGDRSRRDFPIDRKKKYGRPSAARIFFLKKIKFRKMGETSLEAIAQKLCPLRLGNGNTAAPTKASFARQLPLQNDFATRTVVMGQQQAQRFFFKGPADKQPMHFFSDFFSLREITVVVVVVVVVVAAAAAALPPPAAAARMTNSSAVTPAVSEIRQSRSSC